MNNRANTLEQLKGFKAHLLPAAPMCRYTTMRVGGPCTALYKPQSSAELSEFVKLCRRKKISWQAIGKGSNIIVPDSGTGYVFIKLSAPDFKKIQAHGTEITCGAGVLLNELCCAAERDSLSGCEFLVGIPGTAGGAVQQNAGAHNRSFSDIVKTVTCIGSNGSIRIIEKSDMGFKYRSSDLKGVIITQACLSLRKADKSKISKAVKSYMAKRLKTQDYTSPSAGCVFKNPKNYSLSAGKMIDMCGLKGMAIGGARISDKHANFIINKNKAKAEDVLDLIELIKTKVKDKFKVELEEEVEIIS